MTTMKTMSSGSTTVEGTPTSVDASAVITDLITRTVMTHDITSNENIQSPTVAILTENQELSTIAFDDHIPPSTTSVMNSGVDMVTNPSTYYGNILKLSLVP